MNSLAGGLSIGQYFRYNIYLYINRIKRIQTKKIDTNVEIVLESIIVGKFILHSIAI